MYVCKWEESAAKQHHRNEHHFFVRVRLWSLFLFFSYVTKMIQSGKICMVTAGCEDEKITLNTHTQDSSYDFAHFDVSIASVICVIGSKGVMRENSKRYSFFFIESTLIRLLFCLYQFTLLISPSLIHSTQNTRVKKKWFTKKNLRLFLIQISYDRLPHFIPTHSKFCRIIFFCCYSRSLFCFTFSDILFVIWLHWK